MPIMATAQNYKPLEPVDVPDNYATTIRVEEKENILGKTYYSSSFALGSKAITATMGVPFEYSLLVHLDKTKIPENKMARRYVGGVQYSFTPYISEFSNDCILNVDISGSHLKHFAISGIQKIFIHDCGDEILTIEFNLVEQELWRRTAEELISAIDKYKVL